MAAPPIIERHLPHFHRRSPIKESVRVATTANITIATALNNGDTLDGITLATDDRVLVKDQTAPAENGLYVVAASPVRAYDQSTDDPAFGFLVYIREGTVGGGKVFKNTNTATPTIGTTALTFTEISAGAPSGAAGGDLSGTYPNPSVVNDSHLHSSLTTAEVTVDSGGDPESLVIRSTTTNMFSKLLIVPNGVAGSGDSAVHLYYDRVPASATERFLGIGANHGSSQYLFASGDATATGAYLPVLFMMENGVTQLPVFRMNTDRSVEFWKHLLIQEITAPGTPAAGGAALYVKSDGKIYLKNDGGTEYDLTAGGAPTGAAGGDLSGTYPDPTVVDDSHNHTAATLPAVSASGEILITDTPAGSPLIFADLLQNEAGTDLLYYG